MSNVSEDASGICKQLQDCFKGPSSPEIVVNLKLVLQL